MLLLTESQVQLNFKVNVQCATVLIQTFYQSTFNRSNSPTDFFGIETVELLCNIKFEIVDILNWNRTN